MGRGKVNGQLSVVTSVGRKRMGKAPEVQSGQAMPMGRCASPPCPLPVGDIEMNKANLYEGEGED